MLSISHPAFAQPSCGSTQWANTMEILSAGGAVVLRLCSTAESPGELKTQVWLQADRIPISGERGSLVTSVFRFFNSLGDGNVQPNWRTAGEGIKSYQTCWSSSQNVALWIFSPSFKNFQHILAAQEIHWRPHLDPINPRPWSTPAKAHPFLPLYIGCPVLKYGPAPQALIHLKRPASLWSPFQIPTHPDLLSHFHHSLHISPVQSHILIIF